MSRPPDLDRELQRHALALRGIARDLVRDGHVAEDIAQDALLRAASSRDLEPGPMGGWLYRAVVNFARQWRRRQSRDVARLTRIPAPTPSGPPDEALSRAETLQAVTQAVLSLEEPYQTTILLRYFEDLPPRAIAARTNCSVTTVKSRLARGLSLLRARLDRQCRGDRDRWRLAMASTFGLPPVAAAAAGVSLSTGLWIMGTTTKAFVAAGLLFAGGLLVYSFGKDPAPPEEVANAALAAGQSRAATGATEAASTSSLREQAVDARDTATDWLNHPYLLELAVRVVDPTGLPVSGRNLRLAPPGCTLDDIGKATDADGRVVLQWPSRQPTGVVILADPTGLMHKIALQHGTPRSITVGTRDTPRGQQLALSFRLSRTSTGSRGMVLSGVPIVESMFRNGEAVERQRGMHPYATFTSAAAPARTRVVDSIQDSVEIAFDSNSFAISLVGKEQATPAEPPAVGISGTVYGEDGAIAKGVPVALLGNAPQPVASTTTDENGQFRFEKLTPGEFTVRAGGDAAGLGTTSAITTTGVTPVTVNLRRETCVRGRAQTADGKPLPKARIQWVAEDGSWWDMTEADDDGSFVLANLPDARGNVLLLPAGNDRGLPIASAANVLTNTGELVLQYDQGNSSTIRFELAPPPDTDLDSIGVRLWNETLGLGINMSRPEPGKPWTASGLPSDWYRVDLFVPGCGWVDLGKQWLDRNTTCDLGMVTPPSPCLVEVRSPPTPEDEPPPPPGADIELYAVRPDVDLRLRVGELARDCDLLLPVGDYVLARRDSAGVVHFHRFTPRRGDTTRIDLPE